MNVLTYNPDVMTKHTVIPLGRACECQATRIDFTVGGWLNRFPGGAIALYVKDPNGEAYLAAITTENGVASWVLNNTDTQVSGYGSLELALIGPNGERKLSAVATTKIDPSLVEDDLVERPEYMKPWIERAAEIQAATETAAEEAKADADRAERQYKLASDAAASAGLMKYLTQQEKEAAEAAAEKAETYADMMADAIVCEASSTVVSMTDAAERNPLALVSTINPSTTAADTVTLTHSGLNLVSHHNYVMTQGHNGTVITDDCIDVTSPSAFDYGNIPVSLKAGVPYTLCIDWEVYGRDISDTSITTAGYRLTALSATTSQVDATANGTKRLILNFTPYEDTETTIAWHPNYGNEASNGGRVPACSRARIMLVKGIYKAETAPKFEPFMQQTITYDMGYAPAYGGTMDWLSGKVTITHGADGALLAEPIIYQLPVQPQPTLYKGGNTLWSDCGSTSVTYIADTKLYVDKGATSSGLSAIDKDTSDGVGFETDETLTLENGVLSVNTADAVEADNTLPVTSAAVYAEIGNINALLATI